MKRLLARWRRRRSVRFMGVRPVPPAGYIRGYLDGVSSVSRAAETRVRQMYPSE